MYTSPYEDCGDLRNSIDNHIGQAYRHLVDGRPDLANTALLFSLTEICFVRFILNSQERVSCDYGTSRSPTACTPLRSAIRSLRRLWRRLTNALCTWPGEDAT